MATALAGLCAGAAVPLLQPPEAVATTSLILNHRVGDDPSDAMATDVSMAKSRQLAVRVVDRLGLHETPDDLLAQYTATARTDRVLQLTVRAETGAEAKRIVRTVGELFLTFRVEQNTRQLTPLRSMLEDARSDVTGLKQTAVPTLAAGGSDEDATKARITAAEERVRQMRDEVKKEETASAPMGRSVVLDPPTVRTPSRFVRAGRYGSIGFAVGLGGMAALVVMTGLLAYRPRREREIAVALGAPVTAEAQAVRPTETDAAQPAETEHVQPVQAEHAQPVQPVPSDDVEPTRADEAQPAETEHVQPVQAEDTQPVQAEDTQPVQAEDTQPVAAEHVQPVQAEDTQPVAAEDVQPVQAEDTQPVEAEHTQPVQTGNVQPVQAKDAQPVQAEDTRPAEADVPLTEAGELDFAMDLLLHELATDRARRPTLLVIPVDCVPAAATVVASLAAQCAAGGDRILLADLTRNGVLARRLGALGPGTSPVSVDGTVDTEITLHRPDTVQPRGRLHHDGADGDDEDLLVAWALSDVVVTLAEVSPSNATGYLHTWADRAVTVVSAEGSSEAKARPVGELLHATNVSLRSVVVLDAAETTRSSEVTADVASPAPDLATQSVEAGR